MEETSLILVELPVQANNDEERQATGGLMKREKLMTARSRKGWTQEEAAERLGVSAVTVCRWEQGETTPFPYNLGKLCEIYDMTAAQLGLDEGEAASETAEQSRSTASSLLPFVQEDLTLRLLALALATCRATWAELLHLQDRVLLTLKEIDAMNTDKQDYQFTRREALCRLAALPLVTLNLSALIAVTQHPAEEVLTQCTAGLAACRQLSRGWYDDMELASQALAAYLPTLKQIVKDSPRHRKVAALLTARVAILQARLSLHVKGPQLAIDYARQAVTYSQEGGDVLLQIIALNVLAWTYFRADQPKPPLQVAEQAKLVMEQASMPVPLSVKGSLYAVLAKYQALNRLSGEADTSLHLALNIFPMELTTEEDRIYMDDQEYDYAGLLRDNGISYSFLGQHEQALMTFARVIDPQTLLPRIAISSKRSEVEIINYAALASLKLPVSQKDKQLSIHLWKAGIQGAQSLQSEQRYAEARRAYELMEAIWSGDSDVLELHDLFEHW
ncbi:MAG: helix-turn-helix transcriptional regulator [Ktedonobacteraceae bacterium]